MPRCGNGRFETRIQRFHAVRRFQRVLRADQPPDLVEPEDANRLKADMPVTGMGGVERPTKQTDSFQGLTCPVPITRVL
jgi:hypothetical protein